MHRAGLLVALLLAVAAAAGSATLECKAAYNYTVDYIYNIGVYLEFEAIAPVFPNRSVWIARHNLIYSDAVSAQWSRPLKFNVTLEHYAPYQGWVVVKYICIYNKSDVGVYDVIVQTPERVRTTITLTVPATAARYRDWALVRASEPRHGYCSAPPNVTTWPNCPPFRPDPNKLVSIDYPAEWNALQVNGRKPGDVVEAYGVNATIPDPWRYGITPDVGTLSYVRIDGSRYGLDVANVPVSMSVYLHMIAMPTQWGSVKIRQTPDVPLYVLQPVVSYSDPPAALCRPPSCIILSWANLSAYCRIHGDNNVSHAYIALMAVQSGYMLQSRVRFHGSTSEIRLPLGSVYLATINVAWSRPDPNPVYLVDRFNASSGTPYLRVIKNATYYEDVASRGKINGPLSFSRPWWWQTGTTVAVAVDQSMPSIEFGAYVWPILMIYSRREPFTIFRRISEPLCFRGSTTLYASAWLTDALRWNHPDISGGRYVDLLHFLYGESTAYYWGSGDQYGAVSVHTKRRYENTTADSAGLVKLNHTTGIAPTDVAVFYVPSLPRITGEGGGGGGGGVSPWLVALVPTMACRSMFCTSLSPELVGPAPPLPGDRVLPNMGYSIMLMYLGPTGRHRVKVYVEDGYVITSRQSINVSRARNYKLVEIDKEWRPLKAVVVGPGWWVPFRPLNTCKTMPINTSSIYATPDRTGFFKIIVEVNGRNSTYVYYVSDRVAYRITTHTPAPASLSTTPFNITAYVTLDGAPYFHMVYGYGEGGRITPPSCASTWYDNTLVSQLALSGDFWSTFGLANTPLKPVQIQYNYSKPRLELADSWRGLVRVRADGPVSGFAFYAQRGGTWVKIGEVPTKVDNEYRGCLLINASRIFTWDPVLVLPLVEQELTARPGDAVTIWRPETALLFKTWADAVGYPKGARSVLTVVGRC